MLIEYLSSNNLNKFRDYLDKDASENIGRVFYKGIVATEKDVPRAGIIWEILSRHDEHEGPFSRIVWMRISDDEAGRILLHYYDEIMADEKVKGSYFEFDESYGYEKLKLLEDAGFTLSMATGTAAHITLADIRNMLSQGPQGHAPNILSLEEMETDAFLKGIRDCVDNTDRHILPDVLSLPISWYEQEVSCYHQKDEGCMGFLLIHKSGSEKLIVELLSDWGPESKNNMMNMIRYSASQILDLYSESTRILVFEKNENIRQLVSYLFPQAKRMQCIKGFRKEL